MNASSHIVSDWCDSFEWKWRDRCLNPQTSRARVRERYTMIYANFRHSTYVHHHKWMWNNDSNSRINKHTVLIIMQIFEMRIYMQTVYVAKENMIEFLFVSMKGEEKNFYASSSSSCLIGFSVVVFSSCVLVLLRCCFLSSLHFFSLSPVDQK